MNADQLARMLNQERAQVEKKAPQQLNALNTLLDADGDGDVDLSDLVRKSGGLLGKLFGR